MNIQDKIKRARDILFLTLNLFIYGDPGTGKTWLVGSAAKAGLRVLLLDSDKGSMTVRDSDIDVLPIGSVQDLRDILKWLLKGDHPYDVVALDTLNDIQDRIIDAEKARSNSEGRAGVMNQDKWVEVISKTKGIITAFRDLPMSTIVLCHAKEVGGGKGEGPVRIRPALSGKKLEGALVGAFDVVGYSVCGMSKNGYTWRIRTRCDIDERILAKDRSDTLDPQEPNDFSVIWGKVFAGREQTPIVEATAPYLSLTDAEGEAMDAYTAKLNAATAVKRLLITGRKQPAPNPEQQRNEEPPRSGYERTRTGAYECPCHHGHPERCTEHRQHEATEEPPPIQDDRVSPPVGSWEEQDPTHSSYEPPHDQQHLAVDHLPPHVEAEANRETLLSEVPRLIRQCRASGIDSRVIVDACGGEVLGSRSIKGVPTDALGGIASVLNALVRDVIDCHDHDTAETAKPEPHIDHGGAVERVMIAMAAATMTHGVDRGAISAGCSWDLSREAAEGFTVDRLGDIEDTMRKLVGMA